MLKTQCCYKRTSSAAGIIIGVIVFVCLLFGVFYLMFNPSTFTGGNRQFGGQLTQQQEEIKKLFNLCNGPPRDEQPNDQQQRRQPQGERRQDRPPRDDQQQRRPSQGERRQDRPPQGERRQDRPPRDEQQQRRQTNTTTPMYDDIDFL